MGTYTGKIDCLTLQGEVLAKEFRVKGHIIGPIAFDFDAVGGGQMIEGAFGA
jgi:hypothetical protein